VLAAESGAARAVNLVGASWSEEDLLLCTDLQQRLLDVPANADAKSS
jgi:hypothetical protein